MLDFWYIKFKVFSMIYQKELPQKTFWLNLKFSSGNAKSGQKMVIFLGNTYSGDQNILKAFIYHRDTSYYMVLKKIGVTPFAHFASILTNAPVNKVGRIQPPKCNHTG